MKRRLRVGGALLLLVAAGCVSTQERFEKGVALETKGQYAEASAYYIKVLEEEPDWERARERLRKTGALAIDQLVAEARAKNDTGDYEDAFETLRRLDDLRSRAEGVGVGLDVPADYLAFRTEVRERAIASVLDRAEAAERRRDWREALRWYQQAQDRYDLSPERHAAVDEARARVYLRWSEQELGDERYRAAYDRADQALPLLDPASPLAAQAHDLQDEALDAGTRYVAFLPVAPTDAFDRSSPRGWIADLESALRYEYWDVPPLFIVQIDPANVHRELRRLRYDRGRVSIRQAAEIGRVLDADYAVVLDATTYTADEEVRRTRTRDARTRGDQPRDTTYVEERYRLKLHAEVEYVIVHPYSRNVVDRGNAAVDVRDDADRGRYAGNWRDLDLSRNQRRLFDEDAQRDFAFRLNNQLIDEVAQKVAQKVFDDVLKRIQ